MVKDAQTNIGTNTYTIKKIIILYYTCGLDCKFTIYSSLSVCLSVITITKKKWSIILKFEYIVGGKHLVHLYPKDGNKATCAQWVLEPPTYTTS